MVSQSQRGQALTACGAKPGSVEDYPFGDEVAYLHRPGKLMTQLYDA